MTLVETLPASKEHLLGSVFLYPTTTNDVLSTEEWGGRFAVTLLFPTDSGQTASTGGMDLK